MGRPACPVVLGDHGRTSPPRPDRGSRLLARFRRSLKHQRRSYQFRRRLVHRMTRIRCQNDRCRGTASSDDGCRSPSCPRTKRPGTTRRPSSARAAIRPDASASDTRCSRESWASVGAEELAFRLRTQTDCGNPESGGTSGLVAYLDGEPVGWCAVEPRTAYPRLLRKTRVPWAGRAEEKTDDSVWAVTCFVIRTGFRRRGISRALARAAVDFARARGA